MFSKVDFRGMAKAEVLRLLGDPKTISAYGVPMAAGDDAPIVYRYDTGFGGCQYTLRFKRGRVTKLQTQGLD